MSHLDQTSILKSLFDLLIAGLQEYSRDLSQRLQFRVVDIFTFILGETEKEHRPTGTKTDKQAKAASLALTRPSNALLDDLTSEISVNQTLLCAFNGGDQTRIGNAVLTREPRKRFRLEDTRARFPFHKL
jgi:hypothetical protein